MSNNVEKGSAGSSFEDFLKEEGIFEETTQQAVKRVIAFQLVAAMERQDLTKKEMAERLIPLRPAPHNVVTGGPNRCRT